MDDILTALVHVARDLISDTDDRARVDALTVAAQAGGADGMVVKIEIARLIGEAADAPATVGASMDLAQDGSAVWAILSLVAVCFAIVRADYPSRQDAQAARAAIGARADAVYDDAGAYEPEVLAWLVSLAGIATLHLSRTAAERAPAVRVETGISLPSTLLAYDLYGAASRAQELVDRNRVATSLVMPVSFEAVAP